MVVHLALARGQQTIGVRREALEYHTPALTTVNLLLKDP
jgi:hypothetical protein